MVLILYLALYFAFFGLIIRPSTRNSNVYCLIFIPSCWVILEYIRSYLFTGFPWALLGYSQYLRPEIIQIADITGTWGVSFLLILSNTAIVEIIYSAKHNLWLKFKKTLIILVAFLALTLIYGYVKLSRSQLPACPAGRPTPSSQLKISLKVGYSGAGFYYG
jgi:apolipoprotein N-acyltransferase